MWPTISDHLIAFLISSRSTKVYRNILWERAQAHQRDLSPGAFRQHVYRLHKKELIEPKGNIIYVQRKNLANFSTRKSLLIKDIFPGKIGQVLISFDIPEKKKKVRDWLRSQIKYWDFKMIHKSLWLGNGPLPNEFGERLKYLGIDKNVRVFKVKKAT